MSPRISECDAGVRIRSGCLVEIELEDSEGNLTRAHMNAKTAKLFAGRIMNCAGWIYNDYEQRRSIKPQPSARGTEGQQKTPIARGHIR